MVGYVVSLDDFDMNKIPESVRTALSPVVHAVSDALDADVFFYMGDIIPGIDHLIHDCFKANKKRKNLAFFLTTDGGSPDDAYRITRCAQRSYADGKTSIFVNRACKSAGTLIVTGFGELVMSDTGELGPLDMQVNKNDELDERTSSLISIQALGTLNAEVFKAFENHFIFIRRKSARQITTRTAAHTASRLTVGCFARIFQQIDPIKLGELYRATAIAFDYGFRLAASGRNTCQHSINQLILGYPSHGFVIDREEAGALFRNVRAPKVQEMLLWDALEATFQAHSRGGMVEFGFVSEPPGRRAGRKRTGAGHGKRTTATPRVAWSGRLSKTAGSDHSDADRAGMASARSPASGDVGSDADSPVQNGRQRGTRHGRR